jgi:inosine triphosphate pyrophosphatase
MKKLLLVTGNKGKLSEWRRLVPKDIEIETVDIDLPEIQSMNSDEIVTDKAKRAYAITGQPVILEDVSAGLVKLGGLPGPFIKYFIKQLGENALYILAGKDGEKAVVGCTIAYYDGLETIIVRGEVLGTVVQATGENGFGFDKSFIPDGQTKTYGQMTFAEKDDVSHRSKAIKQLLNQLK